MSHAAILAGIAGAGFVSLLWCVALPLPEIHGIALAVFALYALMGLVRILRS
jgi:hypothetical protein